MLLAMNRQHQQMLQQQQQQQQQQATMGMQPIQPPAMSPIAGANMQGPRPPHPGVMQPQSPAGMDQFRGPLVRSNSGDIRQAMQSFGRVPTPVPGMPDPSNPFPSNNSQGFAAQGPTPPPRYAVPHPAASPHGSTPSPVPMGVRLPLSSPGHMSPMPSPSGQPMFGIHSRGPSPSPGPQMVGFPPRPSPPMPGHMVSPGQRIPGPMRSPVPGMPPHMMGPRMPGQGMPGHMGPMGMAPGMRMQGRFPGVPPHMQGMPGMGGVPPGHMLCGQPLPFDPYEQNDEPPPDQSNTAEYEEWLLRRNQYLQTRLKFFETEAQKERKKKKALSARQRNMKKHNKPFSEEDQKELAAVTQRHNKVSKMLEISRKGHRQHSILMQEYGMKQQQQAITNPQHSPLGHPGRQNPMMHMKGQTPMMGTPQQGQMMHQGGMMQGTQGMSGTPQDMQPPSPFMASPQDPHMIQPGTPMMPDGGMQSPMHPGIMGMPGASPAHQPQMQGMPGASPAHQPQMQGMPGASPIHQPQVQGMPGASPAHQPQMQGMPGASPVHNPQMIPPGAQSPMIASGQQSPMIQPGAQSPMVPPGSQSPMIPPGAQSPMITPGQQSPMMPPGSQSPMMPGTPSPMMRSNQAPHFSGPPTPGHPQSPMVTGQQPGADGKVAISITDDNNPFSDGFLQRERQQKMREQQEKQLAQELEQARVIQRMEQGQTGISFDQNGVGGQQQSQFPVQSPMSSPFGRQTPSEAGFPMPPSYPLSQSKEGKPRKRARKKKSQSSPGAPMPGGMAPEGMTLGQEELQNSLQILSGLLQQQPDAKDTKTDMQALQSMVAGAERTNVSSAPPSNELKFLDPAIVAKLKEGLLKGNQNLLLKQLLQGPSIVSGKGQPSHSVQPAQVLQSQQQHHAQQLQLIQQQLQQLQQQENAGKQQQGQQPTKPNAKADTKEEEEEIQLTPEQQKQLEMIEKLPYVKRDGKATENDREILLQMHKKILHNKKEKDSSHHHHHKHKKNKDHKEHKKDKHKHKKNKRKKGSGEEFSSVEDLMNALKQLPALPLSEPEVNVNFALCPLLGQSLPNGTSRLRGGFGHAVVIDGITDIFGHLNGPANPPTPPASPLKGLVNGPSLAGDAGKRSGPLKLKTGKFM